MSEEMSWQELRDELLKRPAVRAQYSQARRRVRLAQTIRDCRKAKGLTQEALAKRLGTTQSAIARLEAGARSPTVETLEKLAAALDQDLKLEFADPNAVAQANPPDQGPRSVESFLSGLLQLLLAEQRRTRRTTEEVLKQLRTLQDSIRSGAPYRKPFGIGVGQELGIDKKLEENERIMDTITS